jgi:hypothetical protein
MRSALYAIVAILLTAGPAWATAPVVAASDVSTRDTDLTGGLDVPLTGIGTISAGNLLIVCAVADGGTANGFTFPGGWTRFINFAGSACSLSCGYKFAAGGETTVHLDTTNPVSEDGSAIALRITGAHASSAPEAGSNVSGTSANPDPPSVTASWGSEDNLFATVIALQQNSTATTAPSGYTSRIETTGTLSEATMEMAFQALTADSTDDPGTWTVSASMFWIAQTFVVRPAGSVSCTGRLALMGVGC